MSTIRSFIRRGAALMAALLVFLAPSVALATASSGSYTISVKATEAVGSSPAAGQVQHDFSYSSGFGAGTTDSTIDRAVSANVSLSASATSTIDLRTLTDQDGTSIAIAEVVCLAIANTGTVEVEMSVTTTTGWQGILKAEGDVLRLPSGARFVWCRGAGSSTTDTTDDQFTFTNTSGATTATLTYTILGRSS